MKGIFWAVVPVGMLVSAAAVAAEAGTDEQLGMQLSLESRLTHIDNFYYATAEQDEERAWGVLLRPAVGYRGGSEKLALTANAEGEIGVFDQPREIADYEDYETSVGLDWAAASRHRLGLKATLISNHDPFGTERTDVDPDAASRLDEWRRTQGTVHYRLGAPTERLNIELAGGVRDKRYTTNREATRFLDHRIALAEARGWYNHSPKTAFFASVIAADISFDEVAPGFLDRSAKELSYRVGMRWAATAKTSGDVGMGFVNRSPDDTRRNDFNSVDWRAQLTWAVTDYRDFVFSSGRESQESFINSVSFINNRFFAVDWNENWTPLLRSTLSVGYLDSEFVGSAREDEAVFVALAAQYRLSRSLAVLGGARHVDRDTTGGGGRDYARTQFHIGFRYAN
jgi:polysaccharide biosynthesis protein VpsM